MDNHQIGRISYGKKATIIGLITNLILSAIKIALGTLSGSISIIGDGLNNLSDGSSQIISFIGFKISEKPADEDHPFGHARSEYIASVVVSVLMGIMSIELLKSSFSQIINPSQLKINELTLILMTGSILVKLWQYAFYKKAAREINSQSLKTASKDSLNDVVATVAVLVGIIVFKMWGINIDGYIGIFVSLFIGKAALELIFESSSLLLGEAPSKETIETIENEIFSHKEVLGVHDIFIHNYGPNKTFGSIHIEMDENISSLKAHNIIDEIEMSIKDKLGIQITAHLDPVNKKANK